jgi:hypothetical protein
MPLFARTALEIRKARTPAAKDPDSASSRLCVRKRFSVYFLYSDYALPDMKAPTWIKRLGFYGFLFFLVKGLLWLLVPALAAVLAID